jgi:GH18 family chitinase
LSSGDELSGYYVTLNSPSTIESKARMSKSYGGLMIWELGQDSSNSPLFAPIADAFPKGGSD